MAVYKYDGKALERLVARLALRLGRMDGCEIP